MENIGFLFEFDWWSADFLVNSEVQLIRSREKHHVSYKKKSLTAKALRTCEHHFLWTLPSALAFLSNVQSLLLNTHEQYRLLFPYFGSRFLKAMRPANFCFRSTCAITALPRTPKVWRLSHLSSCWRVKSKWIWINSHIHASACASGMTSIIVHL